jgi:hypothetical protein
MQSCSVPCRICLRPVQAFHAALNSSDAGYLSIGPALCVLPRHGYGFHVRLRQVRRHRRTCPLSQPQKNIYPGTLMARRGLQQLLDIRLSLLVSLTLLAFSTITLAHLSLGNT